MARMSIDDSFLRDPRVAKLAKRLGWSRREVMGALLDVWAVAYDRVTCVLPQEDVDLAVGQDNFSCDMIVVGLAIQIDSGVRIAGVEDRIRYLSTRQSSGKVGGIKSGESRRNPDEAKIEGDLQGTVKVTFEKVEAPANPSAPDPANPSAPSSAPKRRGRKPRQSTSVEIPLPADWTPTPEHVALAKKRGVDLEYQVARFKAHADTHDRRCVRWNGAFTQWLLGAGPGAPGSSTPPTTRVTATTTEYDEPPQPVLAEILR